MDKTSRIYLRATPKEKKVLVTRAKKKNLNLTDYIFYCVLKDISQEN